MDQDRIVDKHGKLLLGKALAGRHFEVTALPEIPERERWLHEPEMNVKLLRADAWLRNHPAEETDSDQLEASFANR